MLSACPAAKGLLGVLLYLAWYKIVLKPASRSTSRWGNQRLASALTSLLRALLSRCLRITQDIESFTACVRQGRPVIFAMHPHGNFSVGALALLPEWVKSRELWMAGSVPFVFRIPLFSEFLLLSGARNVRLLDTMLGHCPVVALYPGGVHEQNCTRPERECVFLSKQLGFIRAALRHGACIVPAYAFGSSFTRRTRLTA
jgi:hypothetical protein